jgi:hypothetical protein
MKLDSAINKMKLIRIKVALYRQKLLKAIMKDIKQRIRKNTENLLGEE